MNDKCAIARESPSAPAWSGFGERASQRLWSLESTRLCANARRRTGLEDFGEPPVEPALTKLVESLEHDAELRPLGRLLMWIHLRGLLETRLQLTDAWKQNRRAWEALRIERPIFIVGMPRSGSTFLHELLAENPQHRAPRVWEVMFPVEAARAEQRDRARRIRQTEFCLWCFRR